MKRMALRLAAWIVVLTFGALIGAAPARAAAISYTVAQLQAMEVAGQFSGPLTFAQLIAGSPAPNSTTSVGRQLNPANDSYDFANPSGKTRAQAIGAADEHWIQTDSTHLLDLGSAFSRIFVVNPYDHDRFTGNTAIKYLEALEYTVWGNNNSGAAFVGPNSPGTWQLATIDKIYAGGYSGYGPAVVWDDYAATLSFNTPYRYLRIVADNSISIGGFTSGDNEIDFVAGVVPAPPSVAFLAVAIVVGFGAARLRRRA